LKWDELVTIELRDFAYRTDVCIVIAQSRRDLLHGEHISPGILSPHGNSMDCCISGCGCAESDVALREMG
jgi:hypothetical protein